MDIQALHNELVFKATRSGGKGGQNVNKVSTKVELYFDIPKSMLLSDEEKIMLLSKLLNKIDKKGVLKISSQTERSQHLNKVKTIEKFDQLIETSFKKTKKRIKTKPSADSKHRRLASKKIESEKKSIRRVKYFEDE